MRDPYGVMADLLDSSRAITFTLELAPEKKI